MVFYRNLLAAALQLAPSKTMRAIVEVVKTFEMPGSTIEDFGRKSVSIAMAGVYDLRLHHDAVLMPVLRHWKVFDLEGLDDDGEKARLELVQFLENLDSAAARFEDKRASYRARMADRGKALDIVT